MEHLSAVPTLNPNNADEKPFKKTKQQFYSVKPTIRAGMVEAGELEGQKQEAVNEDGLQNYASAPFVVNATIHGQRVTCILDTGSGASIMTLAAARGLNIKLQPHIMNLTVLQNSTQEINCKLTSPVKISMKSKTLSYRFIVLENLPEHEILLGRDLIAAFELLSVTPDSKHHH